MPPARLLALLVLTAVVNLGIGAAFAFLGLWMVLPFAGIEVLALCAAFVAWARHAGDFERIALADGRLRLEVCEARTLRTYELNPAWVSVVAARRRGTLRLALRSHGREIEIGRHLDEAGRERFAAQLRERIGASLALATTRTR